MTRLGGVEKGLFVVLLPTLECNLACQYCFEAHPKGRWGIQETQEILDKIFSYALEDRITHLVLHWHGGEALLMGVAYWAEVLSAARSGAERAGVSLEQTIQTNLTLYKSEFAPIVHEYLGGKLGTSFETVPGRQFPKGGYDRFREVWKRAFADVQRDGVEVGVLSLITPEAVEEGASSCLSQLYDEYGIRRLRFGLPLRAGDSADENGLWVDAKRAGEFLRDAYLWWVDRGRDADFGIHPFSYLEAVFESGSPQPKGLCVFSDNCANVALTIAPSGDVTLCDAAIHSDRVYPFGNIFQQSLADIRSSPEATRVHGLCHSLLRDECTECRYLGMCFGGCLMRTRVDTQTGEARYHYCESFRMLFASIEENVCGSVKSGGRSLM